MKKFLFLGAMAAMLLGTASCSKDMEPEMTDGTVQFTIELPGNVDSRAISDGLTANKLTVAVYDAQGNELTDLKVLNKDIQHETTVQFKLVKGQTYSFAFWAQNEDAPYEFSTASKTVSVSYDGATCNDETRDAFYAYRADLTVDGPINETVKLYRPFAQLNFGASDLADAATAGIIPSQSKVTVSKVATSFNLATGEATGEEENVEFALANVPSNPATLKVENKDYGWLAMNYFLVPNNEANVNVEMTVTTKDKNNNPRADAVLPVPSVPVKKNHRTNIVGTLFTQDANFNVIIDEEFDANIDIYNEVTTYDITEDASFAETLALINTNQPEVAIINIADDVTLTYTIPSARYAMLDETNTKTKQIIFEGAGKENSTFHVDGNGVQGVLVKNGARVTFRNLTISDDTRYNYENGNNAWEFAYLEFGGRYQFENVKFADGIQLEGNSDLYFCDCDFIADGNPKRDPAKQSQEYAVWICNVNTKFVNCTFTGYRGAKIHDAYGSEINQVIFKKCKFFDISVKPGIAIGKPNGNAKISILDCLFQNCQPGDGATDPTKGVPYMYETDKPINQFTFVEENNTVIHN